MGFVQRRLVKMVMRVVSFPKLTLLICAVVLAAGVILAWGKLGLSTSQDELLTPKLKFFRDYQEFANYFPENDSFVVIVEPVDYAHPPAGKRWMEFADALGESLQGLTDDVRRVDWRVKPADIGTQGLLFAPWETVKSFSEQIKEAASADDPRYQGYFMLPDETRRGTPEYEKDLILTIQVYGKRDYSSLADVTKPLADMRAAAEKVGAGFPEFRKPVITGRPALEADEMATSDVDTTRAEIIGLSLVFVTLLIFLRSIWLVIVAELCLGVGIGWTFGWATISVGRLNLLSLVFVIALIGIGMDYLIQILSRYRYEKQRYVRPTAIWSRVFRFTSPPISTACCGAAGAFFASALTDFRGAAELGIIAGGGLLLCLLAGYTVLPALLTVFPASVGTVSESRRYRDRDPQSKAGGWRLLPGVIWIAVAAGGLALSLPPKFDPNLLKLQADGLESVREVRKLQSWNAVILSDDLVKLRAAREALTEPADSASTIDHTESILDAMDKQQWLTDHANLLSAALVPKLNLSSLPAALREHLVNVIGSGTANHQHPIYALYVYPRADLWDPGKLQKFVEEVERRTPGDVLLTGIAPQLYHSTLAIRGAFAKATYYAIGVILLLVFLDLRSISQTLLAISVLAIGLPMLLLAMYAWSASGAAERTGIPGTWNFANFFGLPILIGAGHEYGVFMVHRYREALQDPRRVWRVWDVADRALLLCGIVTSASFGFLLMARHHGLQSLGWVMAVGTACIYLSALLVLRPVLVWRLKIKGVHLGVGENGGEKGRG